MRIEETLKLNNNQNYDPELYEAAIELGLFESNDTPEMIVEGVKNKIMNFAKQYTGNEEPTGFIFENTKQSDHFVAFMSGGGTHYRFDMIDGKVVNEEILESFSEMLDEKNRLERGGGFRPVDTRSWLKRNKRLIVKVLLGGVLSTLALPLVAAFVVSWGPFIVGLGTVIAFASGVAWLSKNFLSKN